MVEKSQDIKSDDNAECKLPQTYSESEKMFDDNDPNYSNQGQAGTSVRHAIAKAVTN